MAEDTLLFLLRRLSLARRRALVLGWAADLVATLPPDDSRTAHLVAILQAARAAGEDPARLWDAWGRVQALRRPQEALVWFWARAAVRNAVDPALTPHHAAQVALAARLGALLVAGPDAAFTLREREAGQRRDIAMLLGAWAA